LQVEALITIETNTRPGVEVFAMGVFLLDTNLVLKKVPRSALAAFSTVGMVDFAVVDGRVFPAIIFVPVVNLLPLRKTF
jgi:hypothetical protein